MAKLSLVTADSDEAYLDSLWKYMQLAKGNHTLFEHKFTSRDALDGFLNQRLRSSPKQDINILLIKPDFIVPILMNSKELDALKVDLVVLLTDNEVDNNEYPFPQVYKYLTADSLLDKVTNLYLKKKRIKPGSIKGEQKAKVIPFFSASGAAGKTTLALATGITLAKNGKKVFYLNLEPFSSLRNTLERKQGINLSQLLLYIQDEPTGAIQKIQDAIETHDYYKFDYIAWFDSSFDLVDLTKENLDLIIKTLVELSIYDTIIIDLNTTINEKTRAILEEYCQAFVLVHGSLEDSYHSDKLKELEKDIDSLPFERSKMYFEKCVPVINRYYYGESQILNKDAVAKIPYVRNIFNPEAGFLMEGEDNTFWQSIDVLARSLEEIGKEN